jgi:hypothetical protein
VIQLEERTAQQENKIALLTAKLEGKMFFFLFLNDLNETYINKIVVFLT